MELHKRILALAPIANSKLLIHALPFSATDHPRPFTARHQQRLSRPLARSIRTSNYTPPPLLRHLASAEDLVQDSFLRTTTLIFSHRLTHLSSQDELAIVTSTHHLPNHVLGEVPPTVDSGSCATPLSHVQPATTHLHVSRGTITACCCPSSCSRWRLVGLRSLARSILLACASSAREFVPQSF